MILICRHGETIWNTEHRKQGQLDSELTELGRKQASELRKSLIMFCGDKKFKVISSPLGRVVKTGEIVFKDVGFINGFSTDDRLKEHSFGKWEGLTPLDVENCFPGMQAKREKDRWNFKIPEGESYALLEERLSSFLSSIHLDSNLILLCHEMVSKTLRKILLNLSEIQALDLTHDQYSFFIVEEGTSSEYKFGSK